jgi:hypothetical protein
LIGAADGVTGGRHARIGHGHGACPDTAFVGAGPIGLAAVREFRPDRRLGERLQPAAYGPKHRSSVYTIVSARQTGRDRLSYVEERLNDKSRVTVTVLKAEGAISVLSSVGQNGKVFVEKGKILANGQPSPQQKGCGL